MPAEVTEGGKSEMPVISRQILRFAEIAVVEAGLVISGVFCMMTLLDKEKPESCVS